MALAEQFMEQTASYDVFIEGISPRFANEVVAGDITMMESLLSPSLETIVNFEAPIHESDGVSFKNWDLFRGNKMTIEYGNPNISPGRHQSVTQYIYRMENRQYDNSNKETFTLRACDETVINNQRRRMSKQFDCETPTTVAGEALRCIGASRVDMDDSGPTRNYIAENVHPFQVLSDQADVALYGDDPSFLHYMTYLGGGTHHFRSFKSLIEKDTRWDYFKNDPGFGGSFMGNPYNIMAYEFPCDFDLLTDILNGINDDGTMARSLTTINPFTGAVSLVEGDLTACGGMGEAINEEVVSDAGTDNECGVKVEEYHLKRQARLSLIQPDKLSLRMVVPFNPLLVCGDMIDVTFPIRPIQGQHTIEKDYGSGEYMIVTLKHQLSQGAHGVTMIEAVSDSIRNNLT